MSEHLLEPALREAEQIVPRDEGRVIEAGHPGLIKSPSGLRRPPFEIVLQTPRRMPLHRQVDAFVAALRTILVEYRYLIAIAQNI